MDKKVCPVLILEVPCMHTWLKTRKGLSTIPQSRTLDASNNMSQLPQRGRKDITPFESSSLSFPSYWSSDRLCFLKDFCFINQPTSTVISIDHWELEVLSNKLSSYFRPARVVVLDDWPLIQGQPGVWCWPWLRGLPDHGGRSLRGAGPFWWWGPRTGIEMQPH